MKKVIFLMLLIFLATPTVAASFAQETVLKETGSMGESADLDWWLSSGGVVFFEKQEFRTNFGKLPTDSNLRKYYEKDNPEDTDEGYHPQSIFRLVTKSQWKNLTQEVYFNISEINLSESPNRDAHNGVFFFNRYQDWKNLYYTGIRVDGNAIIKKKIGGKYYTMAMKKVISGAGSYNRSANANLLPANKWLGMRSEVMNIEKDIVVIRFYVKEEGGDWKKVLEVRDRNKDFGDVPLLEKGYAGIRTDFMDVKFKNYEINEEKE